MRPDRPWRRRQTSPTLTGCWEFDDLPRQLDVEGLEAEVEAERARAAARQAWETPRVVH